MFVSSRFLAAQSAWLDRLVEATELGPDERGGLGKGGVRNLLHAAGFGPTDRTIPRCMTDRLWRQEAPGKSAT
eukprot:7184120-Pyramimonas_sp.AAC.1